MMNDLEKARVIVGLDFGTSRSGFAYAFTVDKKVVGWTDWPGQSSAYPKTLTQMLYGPDNEVVAWGHLASRRYAELRRHEDFAEYTLVGNFKMALFEPDEGDVDGPVVDRGGKRFKVSHLVGDYLALLKDMALEKVREVTAGHLKDDEVAWCLTVPAIWGDKEKHLMRLAAQRAGLVDDASSERLLLVLEPETAAVHCQDKELHELKPGTRFMVVDCGGGTVDITSHEIAEGRGMREVATGAGGALGSSYVDEVFIREVLDKHLGPDLLNAWRREEPFSYYETLADWERLKCNFDPETTLGAGFLPFRPPLFRLLEGRFPEVYERLSDEGHEDGLSLEPAEIQKIFEPVLDAIAEKVLEQLDRMERCDVIFLVGGFSTSPLLRQRVRTALHEKVVGERVPKVVMPPVPGGAVVEGAVSFGLKPWLIRARRSRFSYGTGIELPFEKGVDPDHRKYWNEEHEEWFCKNRFDAFVRRGDAIEADQSVVEAFSPMSEDQTEMDLTFYASKDENVRFTDEKGVEKLGKIRLKMPDTTGGLEREIELSIFFGRTEIEVQAVNPATGRKIRTTLEFASTFSPELIGD